MKPVHILLTALALSVAAPTLVSASPYFQIPILDFPDHPVTVTKSDSK